MISAIAGIPVSTNRMDLSGNHPKGLFIIDPQTLSQGEFLFALHKEGQIFNGVARYLDGGLSIAVRDNSEETDGSVRKELRTLLGVESLNKVPFTQ